MKEFKASISDIFEKSHIGFILFDGLAVIDLLGEATFLVIDFSL